SDLSLYASGFMDAGAELLGPDVNFAIIAVGSMVREALKASEILRARGINCAVYNLRRVKPLQTAFLDSLRYKYAKLVCVEDGCLSGGAGEQIAAYLSQSKLNPPVLCLSWPDKFIEHGSISQLRKRYGLDAEGIAESCRNYFETTT
ncbi:MAG: hypothetical protein IKX96_00085, partial [Firmicutes bacterium]|nr:hypothetical protein [Bacillota bacterium]